MAALIKVDRPVNRRDKRELACSQARRRRDPGGMMTAGQGRDGRDDTDGDGRAGGGGGAAAAAAPQACSQRVADQSSDRGLGGDGAGQKLAQRSVIHGWNSCSLL